MRRFFYSTLQKPDVRCLFEVWHEILKWYEEGNPGDLPYWYLERTNVGHLALAVYDLSGFPLQEFSIRKGRGAKRSPGRADLYVDVPSSRSTSGRPYNFNVEAKQVWCSVALGGQQEGTIRRALGAVVRDCKDLKDKAWEAKHKVALLFVLPYREVHGERARVLEDELRLFRKDIKIIARDLDASFVTGHFADIQVSRKVLANEGKKKYWCPGIVAIGKVLN